MASRYLNLHLHLHTSSLVSPRYPNPSFFPMANPSIDESPLLSLLPWHLLLLQSLTLVPSLLNSPLIPPSSTKTSPPPRPIARLSPATRWRAFGSIWSLASPPTTPLAASSASALSGGRESPPSWPPTLSSSSPISSQATPIPLTASPSPSSCAPPLVSMAPTSQPSPIPWSAAAGTASRRGSAMRPSSSSYRNLSRNRPSSDFPLLLGPLFSNSPVLPPSGQCSWRLCGRAWKESTSSRNPQLLSSSSSLPPS